MACIAGTWEAKVDGQTEEMGLHSASIAQWIDVRGESLLLRRDSGDHGHLLVCSVVTSRHAVQ